MITNSEELTAHRIAVAEAAVDAAKAKVDKLEDHLAGAHKSVSEAETVLEEVRNTEHVFEAPGEHVQVQAQ